MWISKDWGRGSREAGTVSGPEEAGGGVWRMRPPRSPSCQVQGTVCECECFSQSPLQGLVQVSSLNLQRGDW